VSRERVDSRGVRYRVRTRWANHTRNQAAYPLRLYDAKTLEDLVNIVREAHDQDTTVRAVGSGHSWSDVALTGGFLVQTHKLNRCGRRRLRVEPEAGITDPERFRDARAAW
jgi:FAD/FMN-containing dehydrogenase